MCELCSTANDILLSELQHEVMLAEEEAGLTAGDTRRPMSKEERASKVKFREISALEAAFLEKVIPILERLTDISKEVVLAALPIIPGSNIISPRDLVDALDELTFNQPQSVRDAIEEAVPEIEAALVATYTASSALVIKEAKRQGVERPVSVPEPVDGRFYAQAKNAALEPFRRVLTGTQDRVASPQNLGGYITDETIVGMLGEITSDKAIDQARQSSHGVINDGRFDTAERIGPELIYSSEIRDSSACQNCLDIDNTEWTSLDEARKNYPSGGGYRQCSGGARCRGTAVFVFRA